MKIIDICHTKPILSEMANFTPNRTGVNNVTIFISTGTGSRHAARIKFSIGPTWTGEDGVISIFGKIPTIIKGENRLNQKTFALISKWILKNQVVLLQYWNNQLKTEDLVKLLKKI